jgi:release factor glutamine methyltransferase
MRSPFSLREQLLALTHMLRASGIDSPRLSAEMLLAHALDMERNELLKRLVMDPDTPVSERERTRAESLAARRAGGEPAAYIVGVKEFYGRNFAVSPDTLVPRPETELLVDLAIQETSRYPAGYHGMFADFGTGTGCIAVILALSLPLWRGLALDICHGAIVTAMNNARRHSVINLHLLRADFMLPPLAPASLDLLLGNPPYVSDDEYALLDREVRDFEPKSALVPTPPSPARASVTFSPLPPAFGKNTAAQADALPPPTGSSGLECALGILAAAPRLLKKNGALFMEIGSSQAPALLAALDRNVCREAAIHKDLAGRDRVLSVRNFNVK